MKPELSNNYQKNNIVRFENDSSDEVADSDFDQIL